MPEGITVVIRALNEEGLLGTCLDAIARQDVDLPVEVVLVDSGSIDRTVAIAHESGCRVLHIGSGDFSFGRALNLGVRHARYTMVVSVSAHCIPVGSTWLRNLIQPLTDGRACMAFGCQRASPASRTSEINYFSLKYGQISGPVTLPLMNNGNSAFLRSLWECQPFDEQLPAQEDMDFCLRHMQREGRRLFYISDAVVIHHHNDRNRTLYRRLYTELAVEFYLGQRTAWQLALFLLGTPLYLWQDLNASRKKGVMLKALKGIIAFRAVQAAAYWQASRSFVDFVKGGH